MVFLHIEEIPNKKLTPQSGSSEGILPDIVELNERSNSFIKNEKGWKVLRIA
jgi:hypothetical protein